MGAILPPKGDFPRQGGGQKYYLDLGGAMGFRGALGTSTVLLWM